jgi:hypothetical protein
VPAMALEPQGSPYVCISMVGVELGLADGGGLGRELSGSCSLG